MTVSVDIEPMSIPATIMIIPLEEKYLLQYITIQLNYTINPLGSETGKRP